MTPLLSLYLAATSAGAPAARALLRRRLAAGKEDPARWTEKLGEPGCPRPPGPLVWFHGASVGESLSILPLVERLTGRGVTILVTSGTATSARLLAERLPPGAIHQFAPLDVEPAVSRFLDHWRPDLAVWIESEIWPRLVWSVGRRGIPALLLNARMSERSRRNWGRARRTAAALLGTFACVQAQDDETGRALCDLGVAPDRLAVAGSFKVAAAPLPCDPAELARLRDATGDRFVWAAASTHPGEEALALTAHARVAAARAGALLILAPRHPERGGEVAALLAGRPFARRADCLPPPDAAVYLADTLGELGLWYRLARVAWVGGSTGGIGGHNPYEPVALGIPVLHGPDTANFAAIYRDLDAAGGARLAATADEIASGVLALSDPEAAAAMAAHASEVVARGSDALDRALAAIEAHLPALAP